MCRIGGRGIGELWATLCPTYSAAIYHKVNHPHFVIETKGQRLSPNLHHSAGLLLIVSAPHRSNNSTSRRSAEVQYARAISLCSM
ncbi:hypothetical protein AFLA_000176 [Aspergillus flavus NRRL3357]|nr:hypothetical protein AFLA_000176 [Aspergillus flavus NRRL3357]